MSRERNDFAPLPTRKREEEIFLERVSQYRRGNMTQKADLPTRGRKRWSIKDKAKIALRNPEWNRKP